MAVSPGFERPISCSERISLLINSASSYSDSATYPVSGAPEPASDQRFFSLRDSFLVMTAFAALRIFWVER